MSLLGIDLASERAGGDPNFKLDLGDVVARSFSAWTANFVSFFLVGLIVYSPVIVAYLALAAVGGEALRVVGFLTLVENLLGLILVGAVTYGVFEHLSGGEKPGPGEILRKGFSKMGDIWIVGLLTGLGIALGFCALIVPGLVLLARWWLAVPVAVIESPGARAAIERSTALTEGSRWRVFALALGSGLAVSVVAIACGALTARVLPGPAQAPVRQALLTLIIIPLQSLSAVLPAIAYHDMRKGKEGADVGELLRAFD